MLDVGRPWLVLQRLASLWSIFCAILWEPADVKPPRPEPLPDARTEARLAVLLQEAPAEHGDCGDSSRQPPDWLDLRKLARARHLHELYWPVISNAQVNSLFLSLAFSSMARPLVGTGRSSTAPLSRRRYLETAMYVLSWALGDVWNEGDTAYSNAERVRAKHRAVYRQVEGKDLSEIDLPSDDQGIVEALREDLDTLAAEHTPRATTASSPGRFFSQTDMALTQWAFVGLIVVHPEKFGLGHLSDDDLDCFVHFWRSVGHRLGVSERYNLCTGSLSEVRALCMLLERRVMLPELRRPDRCWQGLTRALIDGLGTVIPDYHYDLLLYYLLHDILGLQMPHLFNRLGWLLRLRYRVLRASFRNANGNDVIHTMARERFRRVIFESVKAEKLPEYLLYVFDLI